MELPKYEEFSEKELYKIRRFQNAKMEIYQYSNEPLIRPKTVTQEFAGSYEQKQLLNSCLKNISNLSNLLYLTLNEEKPITLTNHNLKKFFQKNELLNREYDITNLEMNQINFIKKIKFEKIKNEIEYKELCKFIESPDFDYIMRRKKNIAKWILTHEYLIYHPEYELIKRKYSIVLCPSYTYQEESEENENSNNVESEDNYLYDEAIEIENNQEGEEFYEDGYNSNAQDGEQHNANHET